MANEFIFPYRVRNQCKHCLIKQTNSGKYTMVGEKKVYSTLEELLDCYKKVQ